MDIEELGKRIDKYHDEDIKRAKQSRLENLGWISFGFAVAVAGIMLSTYDYIKTNPNILSSIGVILLIISMIYFIVVGGIAIIKSRIIK